MKVVFLSSSKAGVNWFTRYYRLVFPPGAPRGRAWLERSLLVLAEHPHAGRAITEGVREYSVPKTPFSVIYQIAEDRIEVLKLWDNRADRARSGLSDEETQ